MTVIEITGGIATGKSSFVRALLRQLPGELFDADAIARKLVNDDLTVRQALSEQFGAEIIAADGSIHRPALRQLVFSSAESRKALEAILHPIIRSQWSARAEQYRGTNDFYFVDIPLLFETGAEAYFDHIVVVACSAATQQQRLLHDRGLSPELAQQILNAQLDLGSKIKKADHLIWNDSSVSCLDGQSSLLSGWLRQRYG